MNFLGLFASILTISVSFSSAHAAGRACQDLFKPAVAEVDFIAEFSRTPDDSQNGFITDKVPMTVETLKAAYSRGIFPWGTTSEGNGIWYNPPRRGILRLRPEENPKWQVGDRSKMIELQKKEARGDFVVKFDTAFADVMRACQQQKRAMRDPNTGELVEDGPSATWISEEFVKAYTSLHEAGHAHSSEVWVNGQLEGGIYGVMIGGMFVGESMFHKKKDLNKVAVARLIEHLRSRGVTVIDTQVAPADSTSLSVKWGAYEVSRDEYMSILRANQAAGFTWK